MMWWLFSASMLLCMATTTLSQLDDFECEIAPPLSVEPMSCCRISKPFDRANFPECFPNIPNLPAVTTTVIPLPVSDRGFNDDDDDSIGDDSSSVTSGPYNKDDYKYWEWKKDKYYSSHRPYKHQYGYDSHRHYHDDYHGDYHRFGYHGGRYSRQTLYRINPLNQPLAPCSIECIFNQTNIIANGRFDRNIALQVYADYYPEIPLDLMTRTIDRCTKQLRNFLIIRRRRSRNLGRNLPVRRCRNGSGLFAACFNREIYRNCPPQLDTDNEDCDTLRTYIDTCTPIRGIRNNFSFENLDVDETGNFIPAIN